MADAPRRVGFRYRLRGRRRLFVPLFLLFAALVYVEQRAFGTYVLLIVGSLTLGCVISAVVMGAEEEAVRRERKGRRLARWLADEAERDRLGPGEVPPRPPRALFRRLFVKRRPRDS